MTQRSLCHKILVLGLGTGSVPAGLFSDLTASPVLSGMDYIAVPRYALDALKAHPAEKAVIAAPLEALFSRLEQVRNEGGRAAVLTSGDPLFYGIGVTLVRRFGPDALDIRPAVSSLQAAAARCGIPWAEMETVSLHGRPKRPDWPDQPDLLPLAHALLERRPICLLTDERFALHRTLAHFAERGVTDYTVHRFCRLGFADESHESFPMDAGQAEAVRDLPTPNLVFLLPDAPANAASPGPPIPLSGRADADYAHEKGLITKWPARAAALAALRIAPDHCVWDLGAGSGAVAVEAASLARKGQVFAVERQPDRLAHIRENRRRFRALHLEIVAGPAPDCLNGLPDPDRVFIGGGLGDNSEAGTALLHAVWERLAPGGRMVAACVLLESLALCRETLHGLGARSEVLSLCAAHSVPLGQGARLAAQNPVFLVVAEKGT